MMRSLKLEYSQRLYINILLGFGSGLCQETESTEKFMHEAVISQLFPHKKHTPNSCSFDFEWVSWEFYINVSQKGQLFVWNVDLCLVC